MITRDSIQAVKDRMDVVDVVSNFLKLDKNNKACCPFHAEKSPSFNVSSKRQNYKCFGCGAGGDAIAFLMNHEKLDFIQAIEWLANRYNITLEIKEESEADKKKRETQKDIIGTLNKAIEFAYFHYHKHLLNSSRESSAVWSYLNEREIKEETAIAWGFGFAPDEWQFLSSPIINAELFQPAETVGLVKSKDGKVYDFYRNRLIFPIHNTHGQLIGIAGRWIPTGDKEKDQLQGKYVNPNESPIYKKRTVWFGLYQALIAKAFTKDKSGVVPPAFIVEGYLDVISMHENGIRNTVASSGTAITIDQIRILKKYTNHFVLFTDGDASGQNAALKTIDLCLQENIRVEVIELPEGEDPDSYSKKYSLTEAEAS
jgi:DNA primase